MTDPVLEMQGAIVARLKADADLNALVAGRIYDQVPRSADGKVTATFPYVSFGPSDIVQDDADGIPAGAVSQQIDCWSREPGFPEVRRVAFAVRVALRPDIEIAVNAVVLFEHRQTRVFRDPDGLTSHAAIEFSGFVEER